MQWGKFVLVFQAVITLLIGIFMLMQVFYIENQKLNKITEVPKEVLAEKDISLAEYKATKELESFQSRLIKSSYILTLVGLIEVVIISRLVK